MLGEKKYTCASVSAHVALSGKHFLLTKLGRMLTRPSLLFLACPSPSEKGSDQYTICWLHLVRRLHVGYYSLITDKLMISALSKPGIIVRQF